MPLAAPTDLAVSKLIRVRGPEQKAGDGTPWGPKSADIYGLITWTNAETDPHTVELSIAGVKTYLPKGSKRMAWAKLITASTVGASSVALSVKLVGAGGDSSAATLSPSVNWLGADLTLTTGLFIDDDDIVLPVWGGVMDLGSELPRAVKNMGIGYGDKAAGNVTFDWHDDKVALPAGLLEGENYFVIFQIFGGPLAVKTYKWLIREGGTIYQGGGFQVLPPVYGEISGLAFAANPTILRLQLFFDAPTALLPFTVENKVLQIVKGQEVRIPLSSNAPAVWTIMSGAPLGFGIVTDMSMPRPGVIGFAPAAYLVGTPLATGTAQVVVRASRAREIQLSETPVTADATISLTIVTEGNTSGGTTQIVTSPGWLNNGFSYAVGDNVNIALAASPSGAVWTADQLPTGLVMSPDGVISGKLTSEGRWVSRIQAVAPGSQPGAVSLLFTVRAATGGGTTTPPTTGGGTTTPPTTGGGTTNVAAAKRITWVLAKWQLIDLQIMARTKAVESTLMAGAAGLRLKVGDSLSFAIFFIGGDDKAFAIAPTRLRLTIRPKNDLDGKLVFQADTSPDLVTTEPDPYYLLTATTGPQQRETVRAWVDAAEKAEPLPCLADVDWSFGGQEFSSDTFPVTLELDVTRP